MSDTPYMDELSKGPWSSHAKELKRTRIFQRAVFYLISWTF
jgi:hypothetical protein